MKKIDFNNMMAFEFSDIMMKQTEAVSHVTVLDCKHCNDPAALPGISSAA